jgi:ribosomal protein S17E
MSDAREVAKVWAEAWEKEFTDEFSESNLSDMVGNKYIITKHRDGESKDFRVTIVGYSCDTIVYGEKWDQNCTRWGVLTSEGAQIFITPDMTIARDTDG